MASSDRDPFSARHAVRFTALACAVLAAMVPVSTYARGTAQQEARIAQCIRQAAGGRPWLETTLWGLRDQEAGWIGAQVRNTNGSHDLGPLQINSWWVPKIAAMVGRSQVDVRSWLTLDPCFNAGAARWIFLSALQTTGDFWKAVGVYHSPTAWRQRRYAANVAQHMQRRFGQNIFAAAAAPQFVRTAADLETSHVAETLMPSVTLHGFGIVRDPLN